MKCPRCIQNIYRTAPECPHCGFSIDELTNAFPPINRPLRAINDFAGIFRQKDRDQLERKIDTFTRRFPQVFLTICTVHLQNESLFRQYGFWLLNQTTFESENQRHGYRLLILLDPESKFATITFGYAFDSILNAKNTFDCLAAGHAFWLEERYTKGLLPCIDQLANILKKKAAKRPQTFSPPSEISHESS